MQNRISKLVPLAKHALATTPEIMAQDGHVTKQNIHPCLKVVPKGKVGSLWTPANLGLLHTPAHNPKKPTATPTPIHRCTAKTP